MGPVWGFRVQQRRLKREQSEAARLQGFRKPGLRVGVPDRFPAILAAVTRRQDHAAATRRPQDRRTRLPRRAPPGERAPWDSARPRVPRPAPRAGSTAPQPGAARRSPLKQRPRTTAARPPASGPLTPTCWSHSGQDLVAIFTFLARVADMLLSGGGGSSSPCTSAARASSAASGPARQTQASAGARAGTRRPEIGARRRRGRGSGARPGRQADRQAFPRRLAPDPRRSSWVS